VDLSPEQDQAWFSDGLAEEVLNLLTRVPGLHVTARTSSFSFKGQNPDIATIAEKLNVNHILEGSVRKWGNRVRITAQLVEVAGSSHLWSETYDRELDDLFAIQDEIAGSVVQSLQLTLAGMEPPRLGGTGNPKAYEDYLHARFLFNRRSPGDLPRAQHYYRQAVEADPDFGRAWAGLAGALQVDILEGGLPAEEGLPDAEAAVERALALAPELPETQFRAGMYYHKVGQADRGKEHFEKALAGRTDDPHELVVAAGDAYAEGQYEKAIELQRRAIALDPLAASYHYNLAVYLSFAGRYQEADAEFLRTQELRGDASGRLESELPFFMIDQGRYAQALAIIEAWPEGEDRDFGMVLAYRGLERHDAADAAFDRLMARPGDRAAPRGQGVRPERRSRRVLSLAGDGAFAVRPRRPTRDEPALAGRDAPVLVARSLARRPAMDDLGS
jgi:TolB-like protein/Tfp pilus assembly protein PilF